MIISIAFNLGLFMNSFYKNSYTDFLYIYVYLSLQYKFFHLPLPGPWEFHWS